MWGLESICWGYSQELRSQPLARVSQRQLGVRTLQKLVLILKKPLLIFIRWPWSRNHLRFSNSSVKVLMSQSIDRDYIIRSNILNTCSTYTVLLKCVCGLWCSRELRSAGDDLLFLQNWSVSIPSSYYLFLHPSVSCNIQSFINSRQTLLDSVADGDIPVFLETVTGRQSRRSNISCSVEVLWVTV